MILFALEAGNGDGRTALIIAISTVLGGAFAKLLDYAWKHFEEKKKTAENEEKSIVDHLKSLVDRLDRECGEQAQRAQRLSKRLRRQELSSAQMLLHIRYLERVMSGVPLSFEKYMEMEFPDEDDETTPLPPGSAQHKPLAGEQK